MGPFYNGIYWSGVPTTAGWENNIIALNVFETTRTNGISGFVAFQTQPYYGSWGGVNLLTGVNYFVNNTINYPVDGSTTAALNIAGTSGYWTFTNNIINAKSLVKISAFTGTPFVFDHNNYYRISDEQWGFSYSGSDLTWTGWKAAGYGLPYGMDTDDSYYINANLRQTDSAITPISPDSVKTGGTPIEGIGNPPQDITVSGLVGLLGIDGQGF